MNNFHHYVSQIILLNLLILTTNNAFSKTTNVQSTFSSQVSFNNNNNMPLWFYANNQGRWNYTEGKQWLNTLSSNFTFQPNSHFRTKLSAEIDYLPLSNNIYIHNYSATVNLHFLQLTAGQHLFAPIFENEYLGTGSYLFGKNHRPLPRVTAGIPTFSPLPSLFKLIEIKGEVSYAKLNDKWHGWEHKDEYLHEKYAYIRVNVGAVKPYGGLSHSAIMGGYKADGSKIPVDIINTFFAKGSDKIGGGDAANAAGAHMGLYDFGAYITNSHSNVHIYYQKPFADGSGMKIVSRNRDQIIGINWHLKNKNRLQLITLEWINTSHQSGKGMPDFIDDDRKSYTYNDIRKIGFDKFMAMYGQYKDTPYTEKEIDEFLENNFNHGHKYGGRDGYMSNYLYPTGWAYYGNIMGSPLNLTNQQTAHKNPALGTYTKNLIVNDRFKAIHIGAKGILSSQWGWMLKTTLTKNYGTYFQEYPGRYTWQRTEDYFFKNGLYQSYNYANISFSPNKLPNMQLDTEIGYDYGEINKNGGIKIIISYTF